MSQAMDATEAARRALAAMAGGAPVAVVTVVGAPLDGVQGRRIIVTADAAEGSLGSPERDERGVALARDALLDGSRRLHEVELEGGLWQLYVEPQLAIPEMLIVGAGHIARPLCRMAAMLGFRVMVADDRPEFASREYFPDAAAVRIIDFAEPFEAFEITANSYVVLVTRGHKYDYDCILELLELEAPPAYLGMIGSRRRVRAAFEALAADGVDPERLEHVHAPIGLDIAAETPEEIALSIAAEIVAVRRGGAGAKLSEQERVLDRIKRSESKPR
jgi:xanthine dehydrogenase accessory factor